jgi:hypothetical protein
MGPERDQPLHQCTPAEGWYSLSGWSLCGCMRLVASSDMACRHEQYCHWVASNMCTATCGGMKHEYGTTDALQGPRLRCWEHFQ